MSDAPQVIGHDRPDWAAFMTRLEAAEEGFARGHPADFKALWSHTDDVTLSGGLGGAIELGWAKVAERLDWASSNYADGVRSRQEFAGWSRQISLTWFRRRSSKPVLGDDLSGRSRSYE